VGNDGGRGWVWQQKIGKPQTMNNYDDDESLEIFTTD